MAKAKKESVALNIRLDKDVSELLNRYCEETGQTKTTAIERILTKTIGEFFELEPGKRVSY